METIINGKKVLYNANFVGGIYSDENALEFDLPKIQSIVYNYNELEEQDVMDLHEALLDSWFENEGRVPIEWNYLVDLKSPNDMIHSHYGNSLDEISKLLVHGYVPTTIKDYNLNNVLITL